MFVDFNCPACGESHSANLEILCQLFAMHRDGSFKCPKTGVDMKLKLEVNVIMEATFSKQDLVKAEKTARLEELNFLDEEVNLGTSGDIQLRKRKRKA